MSLLDVYLRDNPEATYRFTTSTSSYNDLAGVSGPAQTVSGALGNVSTTASPIVAGSPYPPTLGSTKLKFPTTRYRTGKEQQPFSLEAWVLPLTVTGQISILSHTGKYDGLAFDGDFITFTVSFASSDAQVSWPLPDFYEVVHAVGVYDAARVLLFINGELVSSLDLTEEQLDDSFAANADPLLYAGETTASQRIVFDSPAIYRYPLTPSQIADHYEQGKSAVDTEDIIGANGGSVVTFADTQRNIIINDEIDWADGVFDGVVLSAGQITPAFDDTGASVGGTWTGFSPIQSTGLTALYGVKVEWDGDGDFTVEASLDDTATWTTLTNGRLIPNSVGLISDKGLDLRVTFAGGFVDDESLVRSLRVTVYADNYLYTTDSSRKVTVNGSTTTSSEYHEPLDKFTSAGAVLYGPGYIAVDLDTSSDIRDIAAIEMWVKFNTVPTSSTVQILDSTTAKVSWNGTSFVVTSASVYLNGVSVGSTIPAPVVGQWMHLVIIPSTPINGIIALGGTLSATNTLNGQVSMAALYPTAPSASAISDMYAGYLAVPSTRINDLLALTIAESGTPFSLYDYDWTVAGS